MFIELTDHLRCPADHDESYLVLLPERMEGRSVRSGQLGCPACGRTYHVVDGVFQAGDPPVLPESRAATLDADGLHALIGLGGPGGYMALVGRVAALWREIAELNPGVALVAINPEPEVPDAPEISVIRSARIPLKARSMRSVVLGRGYAEDPFWIEEAARVVLPGLRVVGEGSDPAEHTIDLMASAGGVWVGTAGRKRVSSER
ncbi:MAG TPA: hypothetical protein VFB61_16900 [Gemmatimonadales bacterium]|nr:hypothetical protein [Gemmatimonadales bacterium]